MKMDRRGFLGQSLAVAAGGHLLGSLDADGKEVNQDTMPPILDTHQHLWDLTKLRLSWLKSGTELARNHVTKDYLEAVRGQNVVGAVYMEVNVDPDQHVDEAQYVLDLCPRPEHPTLAAVIGGRPAEEGFGAYITRYKDSPYIKGVRQIVHQADLLADARFVSGIRLLGELGMCFDLCVPPRFLTEGAKLVDRCPDTRFVIDHCGNADPIAFLPGGVEPPRRPQHDAQQWKRGMAALAQRENTICKISGIVARMVRGEWTADELAPVVHHCLDLFGPERVIFAGDWPVCTRGATLGEWIAALKEIVADRDESEQRKLFHDNAARFYGLSSLS